jgi:hypothetical protein
MNKMDGKTKHLFVERLFDHLSPSTALLLAIAPGVENENMAGDVPLDVIVAVLQPYYRWMRYPRRVEQLRRFYVAQRTPSRQIFRSLKVHLGWPTPFRAEFAVQWIRFCWCDLIWARSARMCPTIGAPSFALSKQNERHAALTPLTFVLARPVFTSQRMIASVRITHQETK